jgi:predicted  nucleic acid-binding Zn-ribbon protein
MNEPVTVTYSLEEVLKRIEDKLDSNQKDVNQKLDTFQKDIKQEIKDINTKLDNIQKDITDLKVGQAKLEGKVDSLGKRLDYQEFINRGVVIGLIVALLGGLAKMLGFIGNP